MKSSFLFASVFLSIRLLVAGTPDFQPSFADRAVKAATSLQPAAAAQRPTWANWNLETFSLKIRKSILGSKTFLFGILCSGGDRCNTGASEMSAQFTTLVQKDGQLLLLPGKSPIASSLVLAPIARWTIQKEDSDFVYAVPDLGQKLGLVYESFDAGVTAKKDLKVYDRFFHDFRTDGDGFWFHETVRYQSQLDLSLFKSLFGATSSADLAKLEKPKNQADTFTLYLIPDPFDPQFVAKEAVPQIGYFVNAKIPEDLMIYSPKGTFNPAKLKALRWTYGREIEWVIDRNTPEGVYQLVREGVLAWNKHLTSLQLKVRRADSGEELDSPYKNVISYSEGSSVSGVTYFASNPDTGEIFRAAIAITAPKSLSDGTAVNTPDIKSTILNHIKVQYNDQHPWSTVEEFASPLAAATSMTKQQVMDAIRGVTTHEVGHALGLRHNFKGSLAADDLENFPGGSSVMDYPKHFYNMRIGPYDIEALQWAYEGRDPSGKYKFCSDESTGDLFGLMATALDPECQRYDETVGDPFGFYYPKVFDVFKNQIVKGTLIDDGTALITKLSYTLPHLRNASEMFYDQDKFSKIYNLLQLFVSYPLPASKEVREISWNAAKALFQIISNSVKQDFWSLEQIFRNADPLNCFIDWVARTPGIESDGYQARKKLVSLFIGWRDDVYGFTFAKNLQERLDYHSKNSTEKIVRLENQSLLRLF